VPPLRYDLVTRLKQERPGLEIVLNGGITSLDEAARQLGTVDGVMLGRAAYRNPYLLAGVDAGFFGEHGAPKTRFQVVRGYLAYVEARLGEGVPLPRMSRHLVGLFLGRPGARAWRRCLSEQAHRPGAGAEVIEAALERLPQDGVLVASAPPAA